MQNICNFLFEIAMGSVEQRWTRAKQISDYVGMVTRFIIVMGFTKFAEKYMPAEPGGYTYSEIVVLSGLYGLSAALALSVITVPMGITISAIPKPRPGWRALLLLPVGIAIAILGSVAMMGVGGVLAVGFLHDLRP
ncbi:hypothetical protein U8Q05_12065 [Rhizobium ruizarguesonis]|nr:hypothetical protein U8Q05_12065 [Rhizobium ruizarguesonis]